jgi:hypothetical protein
MYAFLPQCAFVVFPRQHIALPTLVQDNETLLTHSLYYPRLLYSLLDHERRVTASLDSAANTYAWSLSPSSTTASS